MRFENCIFSDDNAKLNAAYVLDATIRLFIAHDHNMMKNKTPPENPSYVKLRREGIPIYQKADMNSQLLGQTPEGLFQVRFSYMVQGLKDDKFYVRVAHFENGLFVHGFILLSDTEVSLPQGNDPVS